MNRRVQKGGAVEEKTLNEASLGAFCAPQVSGSPEPRAGQTSRWGSRRNTAVAPAGPGKTGGAGGAGRVAGCPPSVPLGLRGRGSRY